MNRQEVFEAWTRRKEQIEVPPGFSAAVMGRIRENRPARRTPGRVLAALSRTAVRPWAKAAMIVLGVSLGLARILLTLQLILFA